jgi:NADP-dependent 3-hydroxy acid dehydrogenase YdfG
VENVEREVALSKLEGTTAVVTGASSGIGRATAKTLAKEGAHVFITGRDIDRLKEAAAAIEQEGGKATIAVFDLQDYDELKAFIADAARRTGRLDIIVNAAGVDHPGTIAEGELEQWHEMFETNVIAVLVGSQAAIRAMRETKCPGHIITISSGAGKGEAFRVYGATKAAVNSVCASLRKELEDEPIRAVTIMPGAVSTNFGRNFPPEVVNGLLKRFGAPETFKTGDLIPEETLQALHQHASGIFAAPEDIAEAVLYAVTQPHDIMVSEIVIGPRKSFPAH